MKKLITFLISIFLALTTLLIERSVGIDWDFHPDSVTYASNSTNTVDAILSEDWKLIFNNGYYFWCHLFNESVVAITSLNMIIFGLTNVLLYGFHQRVWLKSNQSSKLISLFALILILFNPYRLHLATTLLKDTLLIYLLVICLCIGLWRGVFLLPLLMLIRMASLLYFSVFLNRRMLLAVSLIVVLFFLISPAIFVERMLEFNEAEMQLREFDNVPTFQEYGLLGVFMRGLIWPVLAVSGAFFVISPAMAYFPVALGSIFNQMYCLIYLKKLGFPLSLYLSMFAFATMVTGFTAYIRYIYPLMVILPLLVLAENKTHLDSSIARRALL